LLVGALLVVSIAPARAAGGPIDPAYRWNNKISYRWIPNRALTCPRWADNCTGLIVTPQKVCPSGLYVEMRIENAAGRKIDWTNDLHTGRINAGEHIKMVFGSFKPKAEWYVITIIDCF
jgi:hypothetical protein